MTPILTDWVAIVCIAFHMYNIVLPATAHNSSAVRVKIYLAWTAYLINIALNPVFTLGAYSHLDSEIA